MPQYSDRSKQKLSTAHQDLQTIFHYVIQEYDNTIVYGYRSPEEQFELFKKGREYQNGQWEIVDQNQVVTYKDGKTNKSKHNSYPSMAIDAAPYEYGGLDWSAGQMANFAGFVLGVAFMLKKYGAITHDLRWGGDWDLDRDIDDETWVDMPHFELV